MNARKIVAVLCLLMGAGRIVSGLYFLMLGGAYGLGAFESGMAFGDTFFIGSVMFTSGYMLLQATNEEAKRQQKEI